MSFCQRLLRWLGSENRAPRARRPRLALQVERLESRDLPSSTSISSAITALNAHGMDVSKQNLYHVAKVDGVAITHNMVVNAGLGHFVVSHI